MYLNYLTWLLDWENFTEFCRRVIFKPFTLFHVPIHKLVNYLHSRTIIWDIPVDNNKTNGWYSVETTRPHLFYPSYNIGTRSESVRRKGTHTSRNSGVKKGEEEEDGVLSVFTLSQFRVCCKDRYYSSTSEHLFSHDKWQNGIQGGRIEKERKQTLEEKSCLLITLSPVLINPSTGEKILIENRILTKTSASFVFYSREKREQRLGYVDRSYTENK